MRAPTVIGAHEVVRYWAARGVELDAVHPRDQLYACVARDHMLGAHYDSTARIMQDLGLIYDEDWDCEDFTMTYVWWAIIAHRRAQREAGRYYANTPAAFECWVEGISHAVVACIEAADFGLAHFFVEPQPTASSRLLQLPDSQIRTITLIK